MKFSVVIPVYNVAPYLKACLDSVFAAAKTLEANGEASAKGEGEQRGDSVSVEVICVDDGSTDGSGAMLDDYQKKVDSAVRLRPNPSPASLKVIHQLNAGVSSARNRGLAAATGEWILFVDADDFVRETWLEDIVGMIVRHPDADLVGFEKLPYYGSGGWGDESVDERDVGIAAGIGDALAGFCVYQFAYSARLTGKLRFLPLSVGEDLVFVSEALARSRACVVSRRREYGYRYREGSATHGEISPEKLGDVIAFNRAMFAALSGSGKRLGSAFTRGRGDEWFATLPRIILAHGDDPAWRAVWELWLDSMRDFSGLPCFPERQRRRAARISDSRTRWSVRMHCLFPSWLKRKFT